MQPLRHFAHAHSSTHHIPTNCTYNSRGTLAIHNNSKKHSNRRANVAALADKYDITHIQETKLAMYDNISLNGLAKGKSKVYYSNLRSNSAGVATIVNARTYALYKITVTPLPDSLQGHALALRLDPREGHGTSFLYINTYLHSGSNHTNRTAQLQALREAIPNATDLLTFTSGDFNFTTDTDR